MSQSKTRYTDNAKFLETLTQYKREVRAAKKAGLPKPRIPEYVGEYFQLIATHLGQKSSYNQYSYLESMISDGIVTCLQYFENYDIRKNKTGNPFNYFTQIIVYAFWRRIAIEHKQQYIKCKFFESSNIMKEIFQEDFSELPDDLRDDVMSNLSTYDNISDFVQKYEDKLVKKKARLKKTKKLLTKNTR